jgi:hypothetical protein
VLDGDPRRVGEQQPIEALLAGVHLANADRIQAQSVQLLVRSPRREAQRDDGRADFDSCSSSGALAGSSDLDVVRAEAGLRVEDVVQRLLSFTEERPIPSAANRECAARSV